MTIGNISQKFLFCSMTLFKSDFVPFQIITDDSSNLFSLSPAIEAFRGERLEKVSLFFLLLPKVIARFPSLRSPHRSSVFLRYKNENKSFAERKTWNKFLHWIKMFVEVFASLQTHSDPTLFFNYGLFSGELGQRRTGQAGRQATKRSRKQTRSKFNFKREM